MNTVKFIIDHNAGKLVKWLRMLGCDAIFFTGADDAEMVSVALAENRIIITRDTGVIKRRLISSGKVSAVLLTSEIATEQMEQVMRSLDIDGSNYLFTRCLECNRLLEEQEKEELSARIPPYVYKTHDKYMECPSCRRIYWKGTHWQAMMDKINNFLRRKVMKVFDAVVNRRTIRVFQEKPLDYAILEKCIEGARLAPTAMNSQLCEYFVADEKSLVAQILDSIAFWGGVAKPAQGWSPEKKPLAYIVVLINLELEKERGCGRNNAFLDIGMALENMALVAFELGVGTCIMTGIDKKRIGEIIKSPAKYEVAAMLALGYPDEKIVLESTSGSVKRWVDEQGVLHIPKRTLEDILHHNRFE